MEGQSSSASQMIRNDEEGRTEAINGCPWISRPLDHLGVKMGKNDDEMGMGSITPGEETEGETTESDKTKIL